MTAEGYIDTETTSSTLDTTDLDISIDSGAHDSDISEQNNQTIPDTQTKCLSINNYLLSVLLESSSTSS